MTTILQVVLVLSAIIFSAPAVFAQTITAARVTEFLASNSEGITDSDGDRSDWIEVWNSSGVGGNLGGWFLTDDPADLTKWMLPAVELQTGGYVVVFASGKDRADPAGEMHTNFKLQSAAGGYLALVEPDGVTIATKFDGYPDQLSDIAYGSGFGTALALTLVETGAATKWLVPAGPVTDWNQSGFDDSSWADATTGIGYDSAGGKYEPLFGAGFEAINTAMRSINPTIYARIPFELADPAGITDVVLSAKWEDGFVAHLNGVEIERQRAPADPAWDSTCDPATDRNETDATTFFDYPIASANLVVGTNVLAIQGLNKSQGSSDFLFSPRLTATQQDLVNLVDGFFPEPTPGAGNATRFDGVTADTKFSTDRGIYGAPFDLSITSATPEVTIHYTTDGTPPSETEGTLYVGPITIDSTTVIRAVAFKAGFRPTNVDTHTYIFPDDVIAQPVMRTVITQDPVYGPQLVDALSSIPTVSLSFAGNNIDRTEIPVSVELLNFESEATQVDAGTVRYGSYVTNFAKRSVRLHFRSQYGPKRLNCGLFDGFDYENIPPTNEFDSLDIRAGNHDMTSRGAYMSNRFTDDSMIEMGQVAPHGRFVHLYFNGEYRGQYHLRERWDAAMLADYLPGKEEEFDTINANNSGWSFLSGDLQDGDLVEWNEVISGLNGATPYASVRDKLDVANLIDFMLLWTYGTSESEFRAGGSFENGVGFKFLIKDADGFLQRSGGANTGNLPPGGRQPATHPGPLNAMTRLRAEGDPDFMTLLADRIHKHYFNDGALTPAKSSARLERRVDEVQLSILTELARWGNHSGGTAHTPASWQAYQDYFFNTEFPALTEERLGLLRAANMYPDVIAPVLSQFGGSILAGSGVTMSTDVSKIYYTLDGSDPRLPGGAISPSAIDATFEGDVPEPEDFIVTGSEWKYLDDASDQGTAWRAAAYDDSGWESGPSELGYGDRTEATVVDFVDTDPATGTQRNATTYFRHQVSIDSPASFTNFSINLRYDDGAAVFVNGSEVIRTSNLPAGAAFDTFATSSTQSENTFYEFIIPTSVFVVGENTIAVEVHNDRPGSSDISFDLRLRGEVDTTNGDNITEPVILDQPAYLNARAFNATTSEWSALTSAFFSIGSVPATAESLVISEIHYHPAEPDSAAEIAVSTDRDDYEFIELLNISALPIELDGVHFSDGIAFGFSENTILDPGARAVLVSDVAAFTARYGAGISIAGEYSSKLNNGGEQLVLTLTGAGDLRDLTYSDVAPWPSLPDGGGYSLVLRDPTSNPDHSLAENWLTHALVGGAPGAADPVQAGGYGAWKLANGVESDLEDDDEDGLPAMIEYALGTSPLTPSTGALPTPGVATVEGTRYQTLSYGENPVATDVIFSIQSSTDLATWQTHIPIEVTPGTFRTPLPFDGERQYLRLRVVIE